MKLRLIAASLPLIAAAFAAPALAAKPVVAEVLCSDSWDTTGNAGYIGCQGPMTGNIAAKKNTVATFDGYGSFVYAGASDIGSSTFLANPDDVKAGTLSFASAQTGLFVLGLKGANTYSLYLFDGGQAGITELDFDTYGLFNGGGAGPGLSHAVLFTSAVPEPGSVALMLAGLLAVGSVVRRRAPR